MLPNNISIVVLHFEYLWSISTAAIAVKSIWSAVRCRPDSFWRVAWRVANFAVSTSLKMGNEEQQQLINFGCPKHGGKTMQNCRIGQNWWFLRFLRRIAVALRCLLSPKSSKSTMFRLEVLGPQIALSQSTGFAHAFAPRRSFSWPWYELQ